MQKNLTVTSSPHLRSSRSTKSIMQEVCLALATAGIAGIVLFGWNALAIIVTSVFIIREMGRLKGLEAAQEAEGK